MSPLRNDSPTTGTLGLYVHVPFCRRKCPYCDFYSRALGTEEQDAMLDWFIEDLLLELERTLEDQMPSAEQPLQSIYLGGGTPGLLGARRIGYIIDKALSIFPSTSGNPYPPEITVECNPGTVAPENWHDLQSAGVNRVSLGAQSFHDKLLRRLGRIHTRDTTDRAIESIVDADFDSWSLDLMFGIPGSGLRLWQQDLDAAMACAPPHLSVYGLTLHAGTDFYRRSEAGTLVLPDDETQRTMFLMARERLTRSGWQHYEISNYARRGHRSRHNQIYWQGGAYLGLGPGAHSFMRGRRWHNPESLSGYHACLQAGKLPRVKEPPPEREAARGEKIMLALRQCEGVTFDALDRLTGVDFQNHYRRPLQTLQQQGLLEASSGRLRLTLEGLLLSDSVFEAFF